LQGSVGRPAIVLYLQAQSLRVVPPESFRFQLCILQRGRGVPTYYVEGGKIRMQSSGSRLKLDRFAQSSLGLVVSAWVALMPTKASPRRGTQHKPPCRK
jgi:hypothetical protein